MDGYTNMGSSKMLNPTYMLHYVH